MTLHSWSMTRLQGWPFDDRISQRARRAKGDLAGEVAAMVALANQAGLTLAADWAATLLDGRLGNMHIA